MSRFVLAAALGVCLSTSVAVISVPKCYAAQGDMHRHEWSDNEDPHWRAYLKERHKRYHKWAKARRKEQRDYWKWRDTHAH